MDMLVIFGSGLMNESFIKYHQFDDLDTLQHTLLTYIPIETYTRHQGVYNVNDQDCYSLINNNQLLKSKLESLEIDFSYIVRMSFYTRFPNSIMKLHVDNVPDHYCKKYALNVPIIDTESSYVEFCEADFLEIQHYQLPGINNKASLLVYDEKTIRHSAKYPVPMNSFYFIRIDHPHRVVNYGDKVRLILTMRFRHDYTDQIEHSISKYFK